MTILITGGAGLLGSHLKKLLPSAFCPLKSELDIRSPIIFPPVDLVIHCAATKTTECETDKWNALQTNILGTINVAEYCKLNHAKLVYISTDYVFKGDKGDYRIDDEVLPQNYYAETKLAGEYVVKSLDDYLIFRLSFYPDEFPYRVAFLDQYTTRLKVSEAAQLILDNLHKTGIVHLAGKKQSVYEFALSTSNGKDIMPVKLYEQNYNRPRDTSLHP